MKIRLAVLQILLVNFYFAQNFNCNTKITNENIDEAWKFTLSEWKNYVDEYNNLNQMKFLCALENLQKFGDKKATILLGNEYLKIIKSNDQKLSNLYLEKSKEIDFKDVDINNEINLLLFAFYRRTFTLEKSIKILDNRLQFLNSGDAYFNMAEEYRSLDGLFEIYFRYYEKACQLEYSESCRLITDFKYFPDQFKKKKERPKNFAPPPPHFSSSNANNISNDKIDYNAVFTKADKEPNFPNGIKSFRNAVSTVIDVSKFVGNEGKVIANVKFVVDIDGNMNDIKITGNSLLFNDELNKILTRVRTKWTPAELNGKKVKFLMEIPFIMVFE